MVISVFEIVCGMYYPVCGMMYTRDILPIGKSSPCIGGSGFPHYLDCPITNMSSVLLNENIFPFLEYH